MEKNERQFIHYLVGEFKEYAAMHFELLLALMEPPPYLRLKVFWSFFTHAVLLSCMNSQLASATTTGTSNLGNHSDLLALLDFKGGISGDPRRVMTSWNDSLHFCQWIGVTCTSSNQRVMILNLESQGLVGSISPSIGNLTLLTAINLRDNSFHGEIPQEIGRLLRLQHLNLTYNSIGGRIPTNLTHCTDIRTLNAAYNDLFGYIPDQLSSLSKMVYLNLGVNSLTGSIPPWIGNFSSLFVLSLTQNSLQGGIPDNLGRLSRLGIFQVYGNKLSGTIPSTLYNISSIYYFSVTQNQFHGTLPADVGLTLPNLQIFAGGVNNFTGTIPVSLSNASGLEILDFAQNGLTGPLPLNLGSLKGLSRLNFDQNRLGSGETGDLNIFTALANCSSLQVLGLAQNRLGGELPNSIANLSTQLSIFTMGSNLIHGSIPVGIENLVNLTILGMEGNLLSSNIPVSMGKLQNLQKLHLNYNRFSGLIPSSLGNLTRLIALFMEGNSLEGSIPPSLGNCRNLLELNLSRNNLNGSIPKQVIGLSSLSISFAVAHNSLTGSLPIEVGNLKNLVELEVSENKLSGEIPSTLGKCISLERLYIEGNLFQGTIPLSLNALRGLEDLDLSRNKLSGVIPDFLGKLSSLKKLDLSFNDFEGEVPKEGLFTNASAVAVIGNNELCGGIPKLQLPSCSSAAPNTGEKVSAPKIIIIVASVVVVAITCFFATLYWIRNSRKKTSAAASSDDWQLGISYAELFKATNGFSKENLIGVGSFGSVYKGVLREDEAVVAVKVLNLQQHGASKSFISECKTLTNIRHRNLVKILTACSSVDFRMNDFKALVFEFMSNGNLDEWLHPRIGGQHPLKSLSLIQRLNIAIDVASALEYLHFHCQIPIVHCDLKPSNVLLDEDMNAHVGDFGLARFLFETSNISSKNQTILAGLKGSIGYVPPEYGMGVQVSILGDVYSYGILLLEMFTGKRPTDDMFKDGLSLYQFSKAALPEQVMEIIDPLLPLEEEEKEDLEEDKEEKEAAAIIHCNNRRSNGRGIIQECLVPVIQIGILCSSLSPRNRTTMKDVVNKLQAVRDSFLRFQNRKRKADKGLGFDSKY